jgi:hypothetical protein
MDVKRVENEDAQIKALLEILRSPEYGNRSTIVYVWRKIDADQLAKKLRKFFRCGISAYHGGLLPETRRAVQEAFMQGSARIVIATMAFGMGLDKPDIRLVVHFSIPKSIEHYVQETGRCSRDGEQGHCLTLISNKDFKAMRFITGSGGGNSSKAATVRRLLSFIFGTAAMGSRKKRSRHELSAEAVAEACNGQAITDLPESWQPYYVSFEEGDISKELNIPQDELHSVLAHFAYRARGHIVLHSKFPTQMKLRFFKTDPEELAQSDPLLRKIMPLAKKSGGVHTIDTAQALATLGGQPSQLSNGLWQAQGDEFSIEKAEYGYMVAVLRPTDEALVESWVAEVVQINQLAHRNTIAKLDAVYFALVRAAEASTVAQAAASGNAASSANLMLADLIDAYFAENSDPSARVAGDGVEQRRMLRQALGDNYHSMAPTPLQNDQKGNNHSSATDEAQDRQQLQADVVYGVVTRLLTCSGFPVLPCDDSASIAHAAAKFLAGINTPMIPASKWRTHKLWGTFKQYQDFELLEELVHSAYVRLQALLAAKKRSA